MHLSDEARDQLGRIAFEKFYQRPMIPGPSQALTQWCEVAEAVAAAVMAAVETRYADLVEAVRAMVEQTNADGRLPMRDRQCFEWPCGYAAVEDALDALVATGATTGERSDDHG